jgi:hypothetical protein
MTRILLPFRVVKKLLFLMELSLFPMKPDPFLFLLFDKDKEPV